MINILIAEDHDIVIRGLKELLSDEFDALHVGEAKNYEEIVERFHERKWDLIMLDIIMPGVNVLSMLAEIRASDTEVPVLILTAVSETEYAARTLAAGANGYITKQHACDELVLAARKVMAGEVYLSSQAARVLASGLRNKDAIAPHKALSPRELEVFCLIAQGNAIKEIAYALSVSAKTVSTYVNRIKEKTGLENYVDIARYALKNQLVE